MPRKFKWNPTFNKYDKEPFGCFVFDDIMSSSLKNGYEVSNKSFYLLLKENQSSPKSIVSISDYLKVSSNDINTIFETVKSGNKIMLISSYIGYELTKILEINQNSVYFNVSELRSYLTYNSFKRDKITLTGKKFDKKTYEFYPQFCGESFTLKDKESAETYTILEDTDDDDFESEEYTSYYDSQTENNKKEPALIEDYEISIIAHNSENNPVALEITYGKGKLYLVSNPLIFTNYGMLDKDNAGFIFSIFSYIDDLPVLRTEAYNPNNPEESSPLRYFLSQRALRWALYITLATIILFMIFTAKRRQRIIPVIKPPENKTVEFVELIGTLYFQRKDYTDLVYKKYVYFTEQIKRNTYIDIESEELSMELCKRLSDKTGIEAEILYKLISETKYAVKKGNINEAQMKTIIDRMNEVLVKIK